MLVRTFAELGRMSFDIATRLAELQSRIQQAAWQCGRDPATIQLLAVTKGQSSAAIQAAYDAGQRLFAENYCQEALAKQQQLSELAIEWHFIGAMQSNKTKAIAAHFAWVHSVASFRIAKRLNDQRPASLPPLNVLIEVNVDAQSSKSGVVPGEVLALAQQMAALPRLQLRGLMCIPQPQAEASKQRQPFQRLAALQSELQQHGLTLDTLSMGMSQDFTAAIAAGSTCVRIGSAIFGARKSL